MEKPDNIIDRKDEIVAALRAHAKGGDCEEKCVYAKSDDTICADTMCTDAADLVEAQATQIAAMHDALLRGVNAMSRAEERIAELEALVDAAKRDFRKIADGDRTWMCQFCAHCLETNIGIAKCEYQYQCERPSTLFEWRGADMREDTNV